MYLLKAQDQLRHYQYLSRMCRRQTRGLKISQVNNRLAKLGRLPCDINFGHHSDDLSYKYTNRLRSLVTGGCL